MEKTKLINSRFKLKSNTSEGWATSSETLLLGEPALELRTNAEGKVEYSMKIGDGTKTFSELPHFHHYNIQILDHIPEASETDENTITFVKYKG